MNHMPFALAILGSKFCIPVVVLAHSPDAAKPPPEGTLAVAEHKTDDAFVPAYLLAAVCRTRGEPGDPAFERRLQLARLSESPQSYAGAEADAIGAIAREHNFGEMVDGGVPAPQLLELAQLVIDGRVAQSQGDFQEAVMTFRKAAAIQDDLPYLEPPYWSYPVKAILGRCPVAAREPGHGGAGVSQRIGAVPEQRLGAVWSARGLEGPG